MNNGSADQEGRLIGWVSVVLDAYRLEMRDPDAADRVYREGLQRFPGSAPLLGYYAAFLRDVRMDYDGAEQYFLRALQLDPHHAGNLGNYAFFLDRIRKAADPAEQFYERAVQADPNDSNNLTSYALFLELVRKDYDRAERYYRRAVELDPKDAHNVGNFALFLELARHEVQEAEHYYQQALEADPSHANNLGNYAVFLQEVRQDAEQARHYYRRAIRAAPGNLNYLGNYAGLLLAHGELAEGSTLLEQLLAKLPDPKYTGMEVEAWFYAYAHGTAEKRPEALIHLRRVLRSGLRSPDWDFSPNIERARQDGHPAADWLQVLADVITKGESLGKLDAWPEWMAAQEF